MMHLLDIVSKLVSSLHSRQGKRTGKMVLFLIFLFVSAFCRIKFQALGAH